MSSVPVLSSVSSVPFHIASPHCHQCPSSPQRHQCLSSVYLLSLFSNASPQCLSSEPSVRPPKCPQCLSQTSLVPVLSWMSSLGVFIASPECPKCLCLVPPISFPPLRRCASHQCPKCLPWCISSVSPVRILAARLPFHCFSSEERH